MTRVAHSLFARLWLSSFLSLLALAAGLWGFSAASASPHDGGHDHEQARQALQQGQVLPLRTVLDKVEREHQGQVLKIEFEQDGGRFIYEIRLLQADGKVVKLKVDAVDGRVLEIRQKDKSH
ncbi:MAG: PepSY domain-containing protein [Desulfovibrionaceae bacterium]|nr:PepSY domain-containing protein [Desulfovibrionaceae bacterium]